MTPTQTPEQHACTFNAIREDYRFDGGLFSQEEGRLAAVKWIIDNRLTEAERIVILLYTDCQSYRKLAKRMGMSHMTIARAVRRIRKKILQEYDKLNKK